MTKSLTDQLADQGYLKTKSIISAFKKIDRADFVPKNLEMTRKQIADYNAPLPIGFNQTISQPLTVAIMLELLQPQKGHKILDIGSGSGWQTALLCNIVGKDGFVWAIERIPELSEFGKANVEKYNLQNVSFLCQNGIHGLKKHAPYDRIIVAAAADNLPQNWLNQLKPNGRLVCPILNSVWLFVKKADGSIIKQEHRGFAFVPLINNE